MVFICKKCRKAFRKDAREFEDRYASLPTDVNISQGANAASDEYCPHCDNHFVLEALTPKASLNVEGEDARVDNRMIKDERQRQKEQRTIFDVEDAANRLG